MKLLIFNHLCIDIININKLTFLYFVDILGVLLKIIML